MGTSIIPIREAAVVGGLGRRAEAPVIRARARGGLALASLVMALAAFCLGSYEAFTEFALDGGADGGDRFAYRVMLWIVLPAGIAAVAGGALALGVLGPRPGRGRPDGAAMARSAAWWGLAVGSLVIGLAAAGAFFMFLDVSVTSGG